MSRFLLTDQEVTLYTCTWYDYPTNHDLKTSKSVVCPICSITFAVVKTSRLFKEQFAKTMDKYEISPFFKEKERKKQHKQIS